MGYRSYLFTGNLINLAAILVESQLATEAEKVLGDLFKSMVLVLHALQQIHLYDIFGSIELLLQSGSIPEQTQLFNDRK